AAVGHHQDGGERRVVGVDRERVDRDRQRQREDLVGRERAGVAIGIEVVVRARGGAAGGRRADHLRAVLVGRAEHLGRARRRRAAEVGRVVLQAVGVVVLAVAARGAVGTVRAVVGLVVVGRRRAARIVRIIDLGVGVVVLAVV